MKSVIYNVVVRGVSIGLTFDLQQALAWKNDTTADSRAVKIYRVDYHVAA